MKDLPATRRCRGACLALVALCAAGAYANTIGDGFVMDDAAAIVRNHAVTTAPAQLFARDFWGGSAAHRRTAAYRPLTSASFALDWRLGGGRPWAFHLTNVLLHVACCLLLLGGLWTLLPRRAALVAALLFAVHPLHTEAVAGLVGRADVLATIFCLSTWWLHRRAGRAATVLAPLAFALALAAKESSVLLLLLLGLVELRRDAAAAARARLWRWAGYLAALALVLGLRAHVVGSLHAPPATAANPLGGAALAARLRTGLSLLARAAALLVAPFDLLPNYGRAVVVPLHRPDATVVAGLALLLAALGLGWRHFRRGDRVTDAVALLVVPGLFAVNAIVTLPVAFAERWWYWPSAGACVLAALGLEALVSRLPAAVPAALAALFAALFVFVTVRRNADWRSDGTLFAACVATAPADAFCQYSLGVVLDQQARDPEALAHYRAAESLDPAWAEPHAAAAVILARAGRLDEAAAAFARMRQAGGASPTARLNYARFLLRTGRRAEAERVLSSLRREVERDDP